MISRARLPGSLAALVFALSVAGCFRDPDPFTVDTDDVAVHMVLEGGADSVYAIVETPGDPLEDAIVRLIAGTDTTLLTYTGPTCVQPWYNVVDRDGCHRARLAEPIQPGAVYQLEVILPGGDRITGTTAVPPALNLTRPTPDEWIVADCGSVDTCFGQYIDQPPYIVPVAEIPFRWIEGPDSERVRAAVQPLRTFLDGQEYGSDGGCELGSLSLRSPTADSLLLLIPNIVCDAEPLRVARFDSIQAEARAFVWNEAVAEYLDALGFGGTVREKHVAVGLEGAWGLFGAITTTAVPITILRDPPRPQEVP